MNEPKLDTRVERINELLVWAKTQDFSKDFFFDIKDKLRHHAMTECLVSHRIAAEYAEVVMDKLDLKGLSFE